MTSIALLLTSFAHAACDGDVTNTDLTNHIAAAHSAYEQLDIARFRSNRDAAIEGIPCMVVALEPRVAAELHRLEGLVAFADRDTGLAEASFAAARDLEPTYTFPTTMVPEGNPMLVTYGAISLAKVPVLPVVPPAEGTVWLNGEITANRREGLPVFFQRADAAGTLTSSLLLPPGASLPTYPTAPPPVDRSGWRRSDLVIAGASTGAGLVAILASGLLKGQVCEGMTPLSGCTPKSGVSRDTAERAQLSTSILSAVGAAGIGAGFTFVIRSNVRGAQKPDR